MALATTTHTTSCVRTLSAGDPGEPRRTEMDDLVACPAAPWTMHVGRTPMIVRPSTVRDLAAVAQMHRRCSARSLLDRYRAGGRAPAVAALDTELRNPNSFVAVTADGSVVATGSIRRDPTHNYLCAEAQPARRGPLAAAAASAASCCRTSPAWRRSRASTS